MTEAFARIETYYNADQGRRRSDARSEQDNAFVFDEFAGYPDYATIGQHASANTDRSSADGRIVCAALGTFFVRVLCNDKLATVAGLTEDRHLELVSVVNKSKGFLSSYVSAPRAAG